MHIDRHNLLKEIQEETKLRQIIRKAISVIKERKNKESEKIKADETKLRQIIQKLILEAKTDIPDEVPHKSTGINVLEDLLKKVIPILEDDYKALTSNDEQRRSFRAHVLKAVINALAPIVATNKLSINTEEPAETDLMEQEDDIEVDVGDDDKFIPVRQSDMPEETDAEEEDDVLTIDGTDTTGRNFALQSFNKVESTILDAYESLADDTDRELFYDYLLTNIKLYFDKFEDELKTSFEEPTTDEYEEASAGEEMEAGIEGELEPEAGEEMAI